MTRRLLAPLLAGLLLLVAVPAAHAAQAQEVTFEAPRELRDPALREEAFTELGTLGVRALRVVLYWNDVAPDHDSRIKPAFDASDPAAYDWSIYAPILEGAAQRGWKVHLTVSGPVPTWATNGAKDKVTRPSPNEFRQFMMALSRRFSGEVTRWSIWNEPNHPDFLMPQYAPGKKPLSPRIYRKLYTAALRGLAAVGDTKPVVLGEMAPVGTGKDVAPLTFLRGALCLTEDYKKQSRECEKLRVDGVAEHPYTRKQGPYFVPAGPNDVTIGVLSRLTKAMDKAIAAGMLDEGTGLYLTEFGIQSVPDPNYGVSLLTQNEYRAISEHIAWRNPRVVAFSQYLLRDDRPDLSDPRNPTYPNFESGLRTDQGKAKPSLAGFRLPLVAEEVDGGIALWGMARPATGPVRVTIQRKDKGGAWATLTTATTDARGVGRTTTTARAGRTWRLRWTSPEGTAYTSPAVRPHEQP